MHSLLRSATLLYAEDDPRIAEAMRSYFQKLFHKVCYASDGLTAWEMWQNHKIDAAILDIKLPGKDGLDIAALIRQENATVPIVIMTAYTDKPRLMRAIPLHLTAYLEKPVNPQKLSDALDHIARTLLHHCDEIVPLSSTCYWHRNDQMLYRDGEKVALSSLESALLALLCKHANQRVAYETLIANVWTHAWDDDVSRNAVKTLVSALRKKLPPHTIENCYGYGYRLRSL